MLPTDATATKLQYDILEELMGALLSSTSRMTPSASSSWRVDTSGSAPPPASSCKVDNSGSAVFLDEEPTGGGAVADGGFVGFNVVGLIVGFKVGGSANVGGPLVGWLDIEGVDVGCSLGVDVG